MHSPSHPGRSIRANVEAMGWTVGEAAKRLGVSRGALSNLLNGRAGISTEMALALERIGWADAEFWVRRQGLYDLARARRRAESVAQAQATTLCVGKGPYTDRFTPARVRDIPSNPARLNPGGPAGIVQPFPLAT